MRDNKYKQAAIAYFIYGVIYLVGAIYLSQLGLSERGSMENSGWVWYLVGALFVVGFPLVIWKGVRWFIIAISVFMAYRIYALVNMAFAGEIEMIQMPWGGEMARATGALIFAGIALVPMAILLRAAFSPDKEKGS